MLYTQMRYPLSLYYFLFSRMGFGFGELDMRVESEVAIEVIQWSPHSPTKPEHPPSRNSPSPSHFPSLPTSSPLSTSRSRLSITLRTISSRALRTIFCIHYAEFNFFLGLCCRLRELKNLIVLFVRGAFGKLILSCTLKTSWKLIRIER